MIFAAVAIFGCVFVAIGWAFVSNASRFRRTAARADGTLVAVQAVTSSGTMMSGLQYRPTVEFRTADGAQVRATSPLATNPPPGRPGDRVRVLYDPADPQRVRLDTLLGRGGCLGWIFIVVGVVPLAIGVIGLVATARGG